MPNTARIASILVLWLLASVAHAQLTDSAIHNMLAQVDAAIERQDARAIANFISPDARIVMVISSRNQSQVIRLSGSEYLQYLEAGWASMKDYRYQRQHLRIEHLNDGRRAQVSATVRESMIVNGQLISAETREEAVVELIDGRPLLVNLRGQTSM